jgi:hypothetical protein
MFHGMKHCLTAFFIVSRRESLKKPVKQCLTGKEDEKGGETLNQSFSALPGRFRSVGLSWGVLQ